MPIDPSFITAGGNIASSLISGIFNTAAQNKANKLNYQMFKEGNEFAHNESELAFNRQADFSREMFNAENEWNSPIEVMKRLQDAGISPWDYFSNGNSPAASASMPTSSAGPAPAVANAMRAPTLDLNMTGVTDSISRMITALSDKRLKDAQSKETLTLLDARLKELLSKANLNDALSNYQSFRQMADEYKLPYEVQNLVADYYNTLSQSDLNKASTALHRAERALVDTKNKALREQMPLILANMREDLNVKRSLSMVNRSQVSLNQETLSRLHETHDDFVRIQSLVAGNHAIDYKKALDTMDDYIHQMHNNKLISDKEYEIYQSKAKIMEHDVDYDHFNRVFNYVERLNDGVNKWAPWALSREQSESYSTEYYDKHGEFQGGSHSSKHIKSK